MTDRNRFDATDSLRGALPLYAGIFFTAMSVLIFQVALTRVFAIFMWYHYAYLVVSLALLGFGASGSLLTMLKISEKPGSRIDRSLSNYSILFGVMIIVAFLVVTRIEINSFKIWESKRAFLGLVAIFLILSIPFLLGGMAIGTCLSVFPSRIGKLYFVDLVGSAIGAICTPLMLSGLGISGTVMASAVLALTGALMFSTRTSRWRWGCSLAALTGGVILVAGFSGGALFIPSLTWRIPFAPNKVANVFFKEGKSGTTLSSAVAQVDVSEPMELPIFMGGEFGVVDQQVVVSRFVTQDGTAQTGLFENAGDLEKFPSLDDTQAASAYIALNAESQKIPEVLVIGPGGGIDVMIALFHHASSVTAVEINSAMIEMVTDVFADFIGRLFDDPRIKIVHEDGRSYLNNIDKQYDIIQLSGVDTFTALSTGVYTLSESYLYTKEAVKKMYARLKDNGFINYSRFLISEKPRETIRLVNIAYTALEELGIPDPWENIAVLQAHKGASTIMRKGPFTRKEIDVLEEFAEKEKFNGLVFHPFLPFEGKGNAGPSDGIDEPSGAEVSEEMQNFKRMRRDFTLLLRGSFEERREFIDDYDFKLSASTDDKPFFFNYFKLSKFFESWDLNRNTDPLGEYLPRFPVGHMVLLSSLFIIVVWAFILIILPLFFLKRRKISRDIKLKTFIYFSSLGIGFMFIEISMMQKFILFLGHPIYSMSVVLGGLLALSGLGALFSQRIARPSRTAMNIILVTIVVFSLFNTLMLDGLLESMLGRPLVYRILFALLMLAPTAFVLGMPFPLGIRMLKDKAPELIPWGWAINGFLSVFSSIMAIVIAMSFGFTGVFVVAGITYAVGLSLAPVSGGRLSDA